ncbi:hypothetical protein Y032_0015g2668 [Ancylostoma ceylanicum]|uniref:Chondroitin proteoglycan 4 domain-containing protein n=1 Tax=Ancylostoma ceylanicum TaxID=53326 RepID=A0A016V900_9BILA|nr:hypothetical protein Y032_0015g2668 [Ancylostoma ceylanicum]
MALFSILAVLSTVTWLSAADNTVSGPCRAYEQFEDAASCGKKGYLLEYGLRNCMKFNSPEVRAEFTAVGKQFLDCTTSCLIAHLRDLFRKETPTCSTIHDSAFDSHVTCYLKCDFCKVCKTEKLALLKSYDTSDFLSFKAVSAVFKVMRACGPMSCFFSFSF